MRLYIVLLHLYLLDSEEIFLLLSALLISSSSAAKARSCLDHCPISRMFCQLMQKDPHSLIQALYQQCAGHQVQLRLFTGSSLLPTHPLTGLFNFSSLISIISQSGAKMTVHSPELSSLHFQHGPG